MRVTLAWRALLLRINNERNPCAASTLPVCMLLLGLLFVSDLGFHTIESDRAMQRDNILNQRFVQSILSQELW